MFFVMEHLEGRIFWDPALPDVASADERAAIFEAMNAALAAFHDVDITAVGLADFGRPGGYFDRQLARWSRQYEASAVEPIPVMDRLMLWLNDNRPPDDGTATLVHGDDRLDNMIFSPDRPTIVGLLDWELSTLGHPIADLAYQCMHWRLPNEGAFRGFGGIDREVLGIPSETAYMARYCERHGFAPIVDWRLLPRLLLLTPRRHPPGRLPPLRRWQCV